MSDRPPDSSSPPRPHLDLDATKPVSDLEPASGPQLLVLGDGEVTTFALPERGAVRIGRGEDVDLRIDRESVSRRHAILHVGDGFALEDLGSSNGTKVGGVRLVANVRTPVGAGDVIEIGNAMLVVHGTVDPRKTEPTDAPVRLGGAAPSVRLAELVPRIAKSGINVLVHGETGAGKEVLARRIHDESQRGSGPFVAINCGALPEALLESELFGHEAGAFTGASTTKPGLLETAANGTVFLDEVGELPLSAQVKLLRVLEERRVLRVGGLQPRPIDVRFVAATYRDLRSAVAHGEFRQDLYYRLSGVTLSIPPLRERLAELPELAAEFARKASAGVGRTPPSISAATLSALQTHPWPGNIRELRNVIERAVMLCDGDTITPDHLVFEPMIPQNSTDDERTRILAALQSCAGNQTRAAAKLGISRKTLGVKMDALGIPRPQKSNPG
ncbi:MAG TPA: sigma 54-interacting transcriptional regulator [Nannocystaceae bacterium]|nr:sigma 54-interacting transcriptional regulator [Nannocystaceae bacterium]